MKRKKIEKLSDITPSQVGAALEAVHKDVKMIAEGHSGIVKRLENIEIEIHGNTRRLDMIEVMSGVANNKIARLEDAVSLLSKELKDAKNELKTDIKETRTELKVKIEELGARLTSVESGRS